MHEQRANGQVPGVPLRTHAPRQLTTNQQALPQRQISQAIRTKASQQTPRWGETEEALDEIEDDPHYYPARRASSALRYTDQQGNPVLQDGKRRYVLHQQKPPRPVSKLFFVGFGMLVMVGLFVSLSAVGNWVAGVQANATYGYPRTWQTDVNVGHESGKSHFLFENLDGHVFFEEIPEGTDFRHEIVYPVTTLFGPDVASIPVTASFQDVNHDGKLDIILHIGSTNIVYLNTGTGFKPAQEAGG